MVNIRLTDTFCSTNPTVVASPAAFIFVLGADKSIIPSPSRSLARFDDAIRNGSPFQINLRPGFDFSIDDTIFENLVKNSAGGGNTELLNRLLHYIVQNVIEVHQDGAAAMTAKQVLEYTAP